MEILVWYNLNHHSFKTEYKQRFMTHKVGEINKFNHLLVQIVNLTPQKQPINEITADRLEKLANRLREGKKVKRKSVIVTKYKYPWWYKK